MDHTALPVRPAFIFTRWVRPQVLGLRKNRERIIKVSPNPFIDEIKINTSLPVELSIYNSLGQVILSDRLISGKTINTSALPSGTYFVELVNKDNNYRQIEKLVK